MTAALRCLAIALALLFPAASSGAELSAPDLEAFLDGIMPLQLAREDIAGATVAVVKNGQVLLAKGYGYADVDARTPVSPDATLFRPGSISKLFAWTAVMQLVEQGKLDLDRDVNEYLDFNIPATYPAPITLRHVMTHTPGFEESFKELAVRDETALRLLGDYLKDHVPARIFPPGQVPAYSNYATAMAGYIVERVSGQPYVEYVEQHIFAPLGMTRSTLRQPLPDALRPLMSKGYDLASGPARPFEYIEAVPAGSASVTAADMARFMIAHLQDGNGILRPETARAMHAAQRRDHPDMNAMALGFYEENRNGHRIIGHGGDTRCFHSDLHLVLDAGVGFFISYNSTGKGEIRGREAVWRAFMDRYFPYTGPEAPALATAAQDARIVAGRYLISRRPETTMFRVLALEQAKVFFDPDGTLRIDRIRDLNGQPKRLREIAPLLFREVSGQARAAFVRDGSGRLVLVTDFPVFVYQKARWYESASLAVPWIVGCLVTMLLTLLLWPVMALTRRHYGVTLTLDRTERRLRLGSRLVCVVILFYFVALTGLVLVASESAGLLSARSDAWFHAVQLVGWLGVVGAAVPAYHAIRSWTRPSRPRWTRIGNTLVALACAGVVAFMWVWNLPGWSLHY